MISKLVEVQLPGELRKTAQKYASESLLDDTDVGLLPSPCLRYVAWWCRDLLAIYEGSDCVLHRKGIDPAFLLWSFDSVKLLILGKKCSTLHEEPSLLPVLLMDAKSGKTIVDCEIDVSNYIPAPLKIIGCFWFGSDGQVCLVTNDASILLLSMRSGGTPSSLSIVIQDGVSFRKLYTSISSCLTLSGNIVLFGSSYADRSSLTTKWKLTAKFPYFLSIGMHSSSAGPWSSPVKAIRSEWSGIIDKLWSLVFGKSKKSLFVAKDAIVKNFRFLDCFLTLSCDGLLLGCFNNDGQLRWTRETRNRYGFLENSDQITDISYWNQDSFLLSTSSGRLIRDSINDGADPTEPFCFPFTFKTIHLICAIPNDRIYIHDYYLKSFIQCSPEELLRSHIAKHSYEEAHSLALRFQIDTDLVFKAKWQDSVNLNTWDTSILTHVNDKMWVLETCISSFPDSSATIKKLLNYGISLTNHLSPLLVEEELEKVVEKLESSSLTSKTASKELSVIDFYVYRVQLLRALDSLCTFEVLFSKEIANSQSIGDLYSTFLKEDLIDFAIRKAKSGHIDCLETIFTRHGRVLLPYRLALLEKIPLTVPPSKMEKILPSSRIWHEIPWRRIDWSESKDLLEFVELFHEHETASHLESINYPEAESLIKSWYRNRIERLVSEIGQISYARALCDLAVENGVSLNEDALNLGLLECVKKSVDFENLTLPGLKQLSPLVVQNLVLAACDRSNIAYLTSRLLYPFIRQQQADTAQYEALLNELREKLLSLCLADPKCLTLLAIVCQRNSIMVDFLSIPFLISKCAYGPKPLESLEFWTELVDELRIALTSKNIPNESEGWGDFEDIDIQMEDSSSASAPNSEAKSINELSDLVSRLSKQVSLAMLVKKHGLDWSLGHIKSLESENSTPALSKILRQSKLLPSASDQIWDETVLSLLEFIRQGLFHQVSETILYTEVVVYALSQSRFQFIQSQILFPKTGSCPIPQSTVEVLVLNAATEFFDNDQRGDQASGLMKLSRTCCTLLKPNIKAIKEHLCLIEATHSLVFVHQIKHDPYTSLLPIQVRLHKDRIQLVRLLLEKDPGLYKKSDWLSVLLTQLVGSGKALSPRSQYLLNLFMGQAALRSESYEDASAILLSLIEKFFEPSALTDQEMIMLWNTVEELSLSPFQNTKRKLELLSIAAIKCNGSHVSDLIGTWRNFLVISEMDKYQTLNGKPLSDAYSILKEEEEKHFSATIQDPVLDNPVSSIQLCDFYRPVGSNLDGSSYAVQSDPIGLQTIENLSTCFCLLSFFVQLKQEVVQDPVRSFSFLLDRDFPSALSHLLTSSVSNRDLCSLFENLPPSSFHYSLAAYFFSLKAALLMPADTLDLGPFDTPFMQLSSSVYTAAQKLKTDVKNQSVILEFVAIAKSFLEKTESSKVSQLRSFLVTMANADPGLVETDERYREEKILELVKTNVWKTVETAVALAEQEGVSPSKIWCTHALWIFSRENSLSEINYEDSRTALLTNILDIEPHLPLLHSQVLALDSSRISKFYSLLLDAYGTKKLKPNPEDVSQLSIRQDILADLQSRGIHDQLLLSQILDAHRQGAQGYLSIWVEMGQYIGLESFCVSLERWILLSPLNSVKESFHNEAPITNPAKLKSEVIMKCVQHYVSSQPWASLDRFSTNSILEDAFQTFSCLLPNQVEELVVSLLTQNQFDITTKSFILSHSTPFAEHSSRLDQHRELVELMSRLDTLTDKFGNRLPRSIIDLIDSCYIDNPEQLKNGLIEFCLQIGSPELIRAVCENVSLDAIALYSLALDMALEEENSDTVEQIFILLDKFEEGNLKKEKIEMETGGWELDDDDFFEEDTGDNTPFIGQLKALCHDKIEYYSLGDKVGDSFKVKLLHFVEKYSFDVGRDISHLQDAKVSTFIHLHWGVKLEDERSLAVFFPTLVEKTENALQSLYLLDVLRDWPDAVDEDLWIMAFTAILKFGHMDLVLACRTFYQLPPEIMTLNVENSVLALLAESKPLSNHYFLYALLSKWPEIQNIGLAAFESVHANSNSYQVTYRIASCCGLLPRLSSAHQDACIQSVLSTRDQDPLSLPLIGIVLADYPGSTLPICRAWLSISKGLVKGYRHWIGLEGQILKNVMESWDSSISTAIYSYLQPRSSICTSVAAGQLDRHQLFTLLVVDALTVFAKNRVFAMEESHYALRHSLER